MSYNYSSNPPHFFKSYKSNVNRAPKKKFFKITNNFKKGSNFNDFFTNFKFNNNLLNYKKNKQPLGQKIIVKGKVINTLGVPLKNIIIEIWQANASGKYRDINDKHEATIDPNFFGYGVTKTDKNGRYNFISIIPGAYPWRNHKNAWRPKHIHFSLLDINIFSRLCTQMYFPDDYLLKYDPIFNSIPLNHRDKLVANFENNKNSIPNYLTFNFDIVL